MQDVQQSKRSGARQTVIIQPGSTVATALSEGESGWLVALLLMSMASQCACEVLNQTSGTAMSVDIHNLFYLSDLSEGESGWPVVVAEHGITTGLQRPQSGCRRIRVNIHNLFCMSGLSSHVGCVWPVPKDAILLEMMAFKIWTTIHCL